MIEQSLTYIMVSGLAIALLVVLFTMREKEVLLPWKIIFAAVLFFIFQHIITILQELGIYDRPEFLLGFVDLIIVGLFIYTLLLKMEQLKEARA